MILTAIETPIGQLTNRAHIGQRVRQAWPDQPNVLHGLLTSALHNQNTTSDYLLLLADALADAAKEANAGGFLAAHAGLTALRHLLQDAAPDRADTPLESRRPRS